MAIRQNTAFRNVLAQAWADTFNGGTLAIYTGTQPATADTAPSGTLLATITLPATAFGTASAGAVAKSGTWSATAGASGTAGWARMTSSANGRSADFSVGTSGTDIIIDNASVVSGGTVTVNTFTYTAPAG